MSDRHELQSAGTHPAPCARHCESTAYEIEIRRLRSELAASREREARMQWQPIETAPKDGAMVLLAGEFDAPGDWRIKIGYWAIEDGDWYIFGGSWQPTRWMPLDGLYAALAEGAQG